MKRIIPFLPRFREAMLSGRKTMTTRVKRMAEEADTFIAFGKTFRVVEVIPSTLDYVASNYWQEEGFSGPEGFKLVWNLLHPRNQNPLRGVYLHRFKPEEEETP